MIYLFLKCYLQNIMVILHNNKGSKTKCDIINKIQIRIVINKRYIELFNVMMESANLLKKIDSKLIIVLNNIFLITSITNMP